MVEAARDLQARVVAVPAARAGKVLVVRARLADDGPEVRLVVDSGAGTSALSTPCARRVAGRRPSNEQTTRRRPLTTDH